MGVTLNTLRGNGMNKEYILNKIKPYLNYKGMFGENDFDKLFSKLTKLQQYDIINILIEANIEIDYENISVGIPKTTVKPAVVSQNMLKIDKLTNEQLCLIYQQGNKLALEALVSKNSKLVWSRALKHGKKYKHKLDYEDLFEYGMIGLIKAAEKFDLKKEAKFITYATWWIDQRILRGIADYGFTIRIPVHYFDQVNRLVRILSQNPGYSKEQIFELFQEKGITREKFEELLMITENIMSLASLNAYIGDDEESELGDFKIDDLSPTVEEQVEYKMLREMVGLVLDTLNSREKDIIEQRFGLKDGVEKTLEQVGEKYNLTRERIRQIEAKALRKLRHPSRSKKLKNFI